MNVVEYKDVEILRKELVVLKHVDFTLAEGEFVYLIGKVGSGKSSLLKSMYAEIPVVTGEARVMDTALVGIRRKDVPMLRRQIGIVFQDFQHPVYPQANAPEFVSGISALDMLFNCGIKKTRDLFWENVRNSREFENIEG